MVARVLCSFLLALAVGVAVADDDLDLPIDPHPDPPVKKRVGQTVTVAVGPPKAPPPIPTYDPPTPPPTIYGRDVASKSSSLVFVIDISGSMDNTDGQPSTRLDRAKRELVRSLAGLPTSFRFNVLAYDCNYTTCFDGGGTGLLGLAAADALHVTRAQAWVTALKAGGATGTGPAVSAVLIGERDNLLVVVLTDGAPNCGAGAGLDDDPGTLEAHLSVVRDSNVQRAEVDVFGIGATGRFRQFCLSLASQNGGSYTDVR